MKNRIKELRASKNMSQLALAEKLGVSRQTINSIETERYDASLPLAFKIARLFEKPIEEIFSDSDAFKPSATSEMENQPLWSPTPTVD